MWRDDADPDSKSFGTRSRPDWEAEGGVEEGVEEEGFAAGGGQSQSQSQSHIEVKVKVNSQQSTINTYSRRSDDVFEAHWKLLSMCIGRK